MLAEMGADVIKIEQTDVGDPYRGMTTVFGRDQSLPGGRTVGYDGSNRSKRGMTLNLRHERGLEVLHRLVRNSDVFVTNFSKAQVEAMRIDYAALREQNPLLIYARLSAWGDEGPRANSQGMDYLKHGPSGLMWSGGNAEDPLPSRIVGAVVDMTAATLLSMGVLGALVARELDVIAVLLAQVAASAGRADSHGASSLAPRMALAGRATLRDRGERRRWRSPSRTGWRSFAAPG